MPADSFESPLTLAACGGHVELANLLIERGANLEEVNDEGYTPLMEAAREGHEEMVALLLAHGKTLLLAQTFTYHTNYWKPPLLAKDLIGGHPATKLYPTCIIRLGGHGLAPSWQKYELLIPKRHLVL